MNVLRSYLIKQLEKAEKDIFLDTNQRWRAGYHLMPPVGWLNDPNGLCMYQGEYHVFFQYSPFDVEGGLKFWGHYKSKDMIHWDYVGVPLFSDQPFDIHGVYSGCALVENDKMYLYYTGNVKLEGDFDYIHTGREAYTVFVESEDGLHFKDKECIMTQKDYADGLTLHVRDPKVWKEDKYYMVLGARAKEDKGVVLLYTSEDKKHWQFQNTITTEQKFGYMWECPDLFCLEGQRILSVSPQGLKAQQRNYQNIHQSGYFVLQGDMTGEYKLENFREWDRGFDFYAPQTFLDEKGRRILIAWAGIPDEKAYTNPTIEDGWQHMLTMPRELKWKNGKIYQMPVEEFQQLRGEQIEVKNNMLVNPSFVLEYQNKSGESFSIEIDNDVTIAFDKEQAYFEVFFKGEMGAGRKSRSVSLKQCDKMTVFADQSILEIYINDGEEVFCTRFYPQNSKIMLYYHCDTKSCKLWNMKSYHIGRKFV